MLPLVDGPQPSRSGSGRHGSGTGGNYAAVPPLASLRVESDNDNDSDHGAANRGAGGLSGWFRRGR